MVFVPSKFSNLSLHKLAHHLLFQAVSFACLLIQIMLSHSLVFPKFKNTFTTSFRLFHALSSSPAFLDLKTKLSQLLQGHVSTTHLIQIHAQTLLIGAHQDNLIATRLIGRYKPQSALRVFRHLQKPNVFPFNAIIRVLSEQFLFVQAFSIFKTMKYTSVFPNEFTFSFLLKGCFRSRNTQIVQQIHTHIFKFGFSNNSSVTNGLLAVYAKGVKDLTSAQRLLDEMPEKGVVFCWTCLIAGYAHSSQPNEALTLFLRMIEENLKPEDDTMVNVLSACSSLEIGEIEKWESILVNFGLSNDNVKEFHRDLVDTVLVYLYGKWGKIDRSRICFDEIIQRQQGRSVLPWNSMIGAYVQNGHATEAMNLFKMMVGGSLYAKPNHVTMVSVLSACAEVGNLELGKWVHEYLKCSRIKGAIESNKLLATALIDMYCKCGSLESAREIFDRMVVKDVVSFNAIIMGLAVNSQGEKALELFFKMEDFDAKPNSGTFLAVLSACNHSGMVIEGRRIFLDMIQHCSITPELEHYACYVDLLARGGHVEEALEVVANMPVEPNNIVLGALLQGCLTHTKGDLAEDIASRFFKIAPVDSAGYVMLSNVFATDHKWSEIAQLRESMMKRKVRKQPGYSWIGSIL